jgi:hypothetical protein
MITLHPDKMTKTLTVYINGSTSQSLYVGGEQYPWIELQLTPELRQDIIAIVGDDKTMLWKHYKLELYSDGQNIRARKAEKNENRT